MMDQPIEGGVGHHRIWEEWDPVLGGAVAGNDDGRFEMTFGNDLIEVLSLGWAQGREAKVIDDQQIWGQIFFEVFFPRVIGPSCEKKAEEFNRFGKEDVVT